MKFVVLVTAGVTWRELDAYAVRMFSQRRGWLEFAAGTSAGKIIVAKLKEDAEPLGYYSGILFHRLGIKFHDWRDPSAHKRKFGSELIGVPRVCISRNRGIKWCRDAAARTHPLPRTMKHHRYLTKINQEKRNSSAFDHQADHTDSGFSNSMRR